MSSANWPNAQGAAPDLPAVPGLAVTRRQCNWLGFAACAALLGYALYAQFQLQLDPCPLCIFQRLGVAAIGVVFLLAALHNPARGGARVYALLLAVAAALTCAVAARHLWIQAQPEGSVAACGAPLSYLLDTFPLSDVVRKVLTGSGECARVTWRFLGLSMPGWVLLAALALGIGGLWANVAAPHRAAGAAAPSA